MDVWKDGWIGRWKMIGWMDGWIGGWMDIVDNVSLTLSSLADPKTKI